MNDIITYAVFCKYEKDEEYSCFSGWFDTYDEAKSEAKYAKRTSRFDEIRIVERVESFEFVG